MPMKAPRLCSCGRTVASGSTCVCAREHDRKRRAAYDATRPSAASRGYGKVWQAVRARVLAEEPWCRMHAEWGERVPATEVDHVDGDATNLARSNLRPLCKAHHSQRTARDQAFGRGAGTSASSTYAPSRSQ